MLLLLPSSSRCNTSNRTHTTQQQWEGGEKGERKEKKKRKKNFWVIVSQIGSVHGSEYPVRTYSMRRGVDMKATPVSGTGPPSFPSSSVQPWTDYYYLLVVGCGGSDSSFSPRNLRVFRTYSFLKLSPPPDETADPIQSAC